MDKTLEKGVADLVGVFTDPIIAYPGGWIDSIPERVKEQVTIERLLMCMKAAKGGEITGTDAEALAYLYPASLEFPLDRDWSQIYLYLGTKVMARAGSEMPEDIRTESLDDYQMGKLNHLKAWIYDQRLKHRKGHDRDERRERKAREKAEKPAVLQLAYDPFPEV